MATPIKNQTQILEKLGITELNAMQVEAQQAIHSQSEVVLLSPTGTGKTLAFLLPILSELDPECKEVQALILAPSRELAMQIEQVARDMGTGYKCNVFYGGRNFSKDRMELNSRPALLIGTPGRIADHLRRKTFVTHDIKTLVLDEFDKSLEIGFETDMKEICYKLNVSKKVLTSATTEVNLPSFVSLSNPIFIDFLHEGVTQLQIKKVISPSKDKLDTLVDTLCHLGPKPGIIFCNFKESIQRVSDHLNEKGIDHGCFYGGMEQKDRERALVKFRNGTHRLIIATDLAARGIDVPEIEMIIHYHLPLRSQEFTHRNGRTARMHKGGTAYILQWEEEVLPEFITTEEIETLENAHNPKPSGWTTLFISGGRKDKISKGDVAGLLYKTGGLDKGDVGPIELKSDCSFVGVKSTTVSKLLPLINNQKLKKKKVRVTEI